MLLLVIPFTIGWACMIWAPNLATMIVGRVLLGLSGGAFCVTAPMFIGEIAEKEIRGTLGSFFQVSQHFLPELNFLKFLFFLVDDNYWNIVCIRCRCWS